MTRKTLVRVILVTVMVTVLGTASLIIVNNSASAVVEAPSEWLH